MIGTAHRPRIWRIVFTDLTLLMLLSFLVVLVILLMYFHPPGTEADDSDPPGMLIVDIAWPADRNVDVDLWIKAPEGGVIGYSRKDSDVMNLLRDDLGYTHDPGSLNAETAYSRALPAGEWIINVHLYSLKDNKGAVPVTVIVRKKANQGNGSIQRLAEREVVLAEHGQEKTAVRFQLDDDGNVVSGSFSDSCVYIREPLREGKPC